MPLNDFPRYPLMFGPSPVHRLDRLSEHLGGAAIWAKREDCNSGLAYGGNKVRKLEYLVPEARLVSSPAAPCGAKSSASPVSSGRSSSPRWPCRGWRGSLRSRNARPGRGPR
jgi:hypothetical protein